KKLARLLKKGRYLDRDGLYAQVKSRTNRSWIALYQIRGKKREMGLGSLSDFTLEEARQRHRKLVRQPLADGIDPLLARRAEQATGNKTFAAVCSEYYDAHAEAWSSKYRADFTCTLRIHAYPILGSLPIAAIDQPLVMSVLQPIWKVKPVTAQRLQRWLKVI